MQRALGLRTVFQNLAGDRTDSTSRAFGVIPARPHTLATCPIFRRHLNPRQHEESRVVDHEGVVLLTLLYCPSDEAVSRGELLGGGAEAKHADGLAWEIPKRIEMRDDRVTNGWKASCMTVWSRFPSPRQVPRLLRYRSRADQPRMFLS